MLSADSLHVIAQHARDARKAQGDACDISGTEGVLHLGLFGDDREVQAKLWRTWVFGVSAEVFPSITSGY
jgi:hypothetical protein